MISLFEKTDQPTMAEFNERFSQANEDINSVLEIASVKTKYVYGSFTATGNTLVTVDLGTRPKIVFIYNGANNDILVSVEAATASRNEIPRIYSDALSYGGNGCITNTGFTFKNGTLQSVTMRYVAIYEGAD